VQHDAAISRCPVAPAQQRFSQAEILAEIFAETGRHNRDLEREMGRVRLPREPWIVPPANA
jgi:hypothetical protein